MITPGLAAELELLTQALDLPGADVRETLTLLVADARSAVESYLGLSVAIGVGRARFDLTVLLDPSSPTPIRTSLLVPLWPAGHSGDSPSLALILYAAVPGAFVDLAADLRWVTGRPAWELPLDQHRVVETRHTPLTALSVVNQAVGVLLGQGWTPEDAERELHRLAARAGLELVDAATLVLAGTTVTAAPVLDVGDPSVPPPMQT